jgi:hypothetical protein
MLKPRMAPKNRWTIGQEMHIAQQKADREAKKKAVKKGGKEAKGGSGGGSLLSGTLLPDLGAIKRVPHPVKSEPVSAPIKSAPVGTNPRGAALRKTPKKRGSVLERTFGGGKAKTFNQLLRNTPGDYRPTQRAGSALVNEDRSRRLGGVGLDYNDSPARIDNW